MKLHIKKLTGKVGFMVAMAGAAVIGGVSTGVVMASIPDSNGNLNTCYRNNGGNLRVIDTAAESCSNHETAFNLSQSVANSSTAYFSTKNEAVDTTSLRNIIDYEFLPTNARYCLKVSFEPLAGVTNYSVDLSGHGGAEADSVSSDCGSNYNVEFYPTAESPDPNAYLWLSR